MQGGWWVAGSVLEKITSKNLQWGVAAKISRRTVESPLDLVLALGQFFTIHTILHLGK